MTIDIDLDTIVAEGYLAAGVKPSVIAARSKAGRDLVERLKLGQGRVRVPQSINTWSKQDDDYLRSNYRYMTDEEVGQALGRSAVGVLIRRKRLGLPAPSKHPDEMTSRVVASALGVDEHAVCHWVDSGILRGRIMPGGRRIRLVRRIDFMLWVINPESWLRFKIGRVPDPHIRRLIELRMMRWGDAWWTTRDVADHLGVDIRAVNARIRRDTLRHVKVRNISGRHEAPAWSYNFVRRSDALGLAVGAGKGSATTLEQFIVQAVGAGIPQVCAAKMIGWTEKKLSHWLCRHEGGAKAQAFVDWRTIQHIPFVRRAVERYHARRRLGYDEMLVLLGILRAWNAHHELGLAVGRGKKLTVGTIERAHKRVLDVGQGRIDPFDVGNKNG